MHTLPKARELPNLRSWWEHHVLFEPKDWIQVEVTSQCNAACIYCPRTVYRDSWRNRSLPLDLYERLVPALGKAGLVYLQGWGEPLLHPDLPVMIAMAKAAGTRVGITTNGMRLDAPMARALVASGLDVLAVSLAGTSSACNDRIRAGTRLETVMANMALLEEVKRQYRSTTPVVHVAYMLLASGLEEIQALPDLLKTINVAQVVISLLDFEPAGGLAQEVLPVNANHDGGEVDAIFRNLREKGRQMGLEIHTPRVGPAGDRQACKENIQGALFVSAEGAVSPCVFTNMPLPRPTLCYHGQSRPYRRLTFGNIGEEWLPVIWRRPDYVRWRDAHATGAVPDPCPGCAKLLRQP
jgi:MoaA/NifB/PqqE/SkfB family radical SAM enzyme